jgi:hypothetical protein
MDLDSGWEFGVFFEFGGTWTHAYTEQRRYRSRAPVIGLYVVPWLYTMGCVDYTGVAEQRAYRDDGGLGGTKGEHVYES